MKFKESKISCFNPMKRNLNAGFIVHNFIVRNTIVYRRRNKKLVTDCKHLIFFQRFHSNLI